MKELESMYGGYRMKIRYSDNEDFAQVSVYDLSNLRFPLMWSKGMSKAQANGAKALFEASGYFEIA